MDSVQVLFQCAINPSHSKFSAQAQPKFGAVLEAGLSGTPTLRSAGNQTEKVRLGASVKEKFGCKGGSSCGRLSRWNYHIWDAESKTNGLITRTASNR